MATAPVLSTLPVSLRLFLIRHGETVDNVAQLYAGSRDSELTNHGHQQATRLGLHFKSLGLTFTHIFSSHLKRAYKTASLIREAQVPPRTDLDTVIGVPDVVQVPAIMEQDFGSYEGKKFFERAADDKVTGKESHRRVHKADPGFVDVESKESMAQRADTFLDTHLLPLFDEQASDTAPIVVIVSHGIILSVLWKRLLLRLPPKSVSFSPELLASTRVFSLEHLGGWSNTGYLELQMAKSVVPTTVPIAAPLPPAIEVAPPDEVKVEVSREGGTDGTKFNIECEANTRGQLGRSADDHRITPALSTSHPKLPASWTTTILAVNGRDHLLRLKRTGGGVGSARHDTSQKSIDNFFKRRKVE